MNCFQGPDRYNTGRPMGAKNLDVGLGTSGGEWLFRQEGLVLGPVPATKIVELLYEGVLDGRSDVAPLGSSEFRPLGEVDYFKIHCAKADAKRRVQIIEKRGAGRDHPVLLSLPESRYLKCFVLRVT